MKRIICAILAMLLLGSLLAGCGAADTRNTQPVLAAPPETEPTEKAVSTDSTEGTDFYNITREEETPTVAVQSQSVYIPGTWGEKFVRSNGYTYPYEFDEPLLSCQGFTLDFVLIEVMEGNLDGNYRWEIYVRTTGGTWKSAELFQLEGNEISVDVRFDAPMDIAAVAVVCGKKTNASYRTGFGVRDPV